ncbi:alpha/beta hydrolase [Glaciimonas sp. Gout2]|uniref:alpha/beta hydrolase n=1 Tax=unclassified Glaciimonas TaxID=2644401 RepID=UPI002B231A18|nr:MULTISPECIES: alpha/beta hydrolase [unclassified Glaciimonas]MEB0011519.1 alpha/beta hydrolase [Glaciimonas sp. Cout2]MEB0081316.1 alpha/beta hydrolase [Glaciimonas sp. Gout2]
METDKDKPMKNVAAGNPSVDHQVQAFLEKLAAAGGEPMEKLSPEEARKVLANAQSGVNLTLPAAEVMEKMINVDGGDIKLTIVRPVDVSEALPAFMFFHGGGWVLGDFPTHERMVRDLVVQSGAVAVFVNYTPSPEAQYGIAIKQAYAATKWVSEHGNEMRVDGARLAVAGNSVGGNMATVVALMAKDRGGPPLRAQILFWPVTDANFETASYKQFAEGHFLTRNMMMWFWDNYTTDLAKRSEITASPLQGSTAQFKGLPPTLIHTAENDVLRDEGEAYGRKLDAAGVPVTSVRFNGMIHDFGLLNAISEVPAVRSSIEHAGEELKKQLK